jgi:hypothetical protein
LDLSNSLPICPGDSTSSITLFLYTSLASITLDFSQESEDKDKNGSEVKAKLRGKFEYNVDATESEEFKWAGKCGWTRWWKTRIRMQVRWRRKLSLGKNLFRLISGEPSAQT